MAWIESHLDLVGHPKTKKAARALDIGIPQLIGHLHCLWYWAASYAQDGDLSGYDEYDISDAALWEGDPAVFVQALLSAGREGQAGFLECNDGDLSIHDWWEYAGRLIERRKQDADRKRTERALSMDNGRTSAGRPQDGGRTADVPDLTGPNRTGPNRTKPNLTGPSANARARTSASPQKCAESDDGDPPEQVATANPEASPDDPVRQVFEAYRAKIQPAARICPREKIRARLKRFNVDELMAGIEHFAADFWWMQHNGNRGAPWFFHSDARSEQFLNLVPRQEGDSGLSGDRATSRTIPRPRFDYPNIVANNDDG